MANIFQNSRKSVDIMVAVQKEAEVCLQFV